MKKILLSLAIAATLPLAACGKRGNLDAPENTTYPRQYPAGPVYQPQASPVDAETPQQIEPIDPLDAPSSPLRRSP